MSQVRHISSIAGTQASAACPVPAEREKRVFYSLADAHVNTILNRGLEHIEE